MFSIEESGSPSQRTNCSMSDEEKGQFEVVAVLRIIMASLSIMGALSIVVSAIRRRTACNPKVHPIFILSIVDTLLSVMWITGSVVWLKSSQTSVVCCFAINLITVILQSVSMNVTLIYALLAYSSIRQKDISGTYYMVQGRQIYVHVWPPQVSFIAYSIAWTLPCLLTLTPFAILSVKFRLYSDAKTYSCWCLPFYGNVLPRPELGYDTNATDRNHYLHHLHYYVASYSGVLTVNLAIVFFSMVLSYCRVLRHLKRMRLKQERNEHSTAYRATQAMILEGQYDARKRVFLFISIYFVTGITTFVLGVTGIVIVFTDYHTNYAYDKISDHKVMIGIYTFLLCEGVLVPLQGFLNAVAYGWTRGDFLSVMSTQHNLNNLSDSVHHNFYGSVNRTHCSVRRRVSEDDEGEWESSEAESTRHIPIPKERKEQRRDLAITPGTPNNSLHDE